MKKIQRPEVGEYIPYAQAYIDLVPDDGLIVQHLQDNLQMVKKLIRAQSEEKLVTPCADGEWTIKEILVHVTDTERIFAYRLLRFARNDTTNLPGFDQDDYAAYAGANDRPIEDLLEELTAVRTASICLLKSLNDDAWQRAGLANGHRTSVRALSYMMVGHEMHHVKSIQENYLSA